MSGAKTRRPAALLLVVAAALTALVAGATQAGAAPATSETTTFTLHLPSTDGKSAAAAIVCHGRSDLLVIRRSGNDYAQGTGRTDCPVTLHNVTAQTTLYQWSAPLSRWEPVSIGNYDSRPGRKAESRTSGYRCTSTPRYYVASTFHYVRLGNQHATAVSTSRYAGC
ncbi:hypothetical protein FHS29_007256 [Saccharothrix tamanrassetensis]|uniref:Ig-like domain-containing protein n=1 Tax=Saccharothrix tamanrassetensis TaxID=1051531 RepID=A0A841CWX6_9PSEU|nr:hypothetical protein [Saccharothrix tamanrassetensis]MBB5960628.1 hypothetical protein [Saccharothrix tamanrassetensis]